MRIDWKSVFVGLGLAGLLAVLAYFGLALSRGGFEQANEVVGIAAIPTDTPAPADTPASVATDTPAPVATDTPAPVVTDTPAPVATDTPAPVVTDTPAPVATDTPTVIMSTPISAQFRQVVAFTATATPTATPSLNTQQLCVEKRDVVVYQAIELPLADPCPDREGLVYAISFANQIITKAEWIGEWGVRAFALTKADGDKLTADVSIWLVPQSGGGAPSSGGDSPQPTVTPGGMWATVTPPAPQPTTGGMWATVTPSAP